jgi:hypothetical protein
MQQNKWIALFAHYDVEKCNWYAVITVISKSQKVPPRPAARSRRLARDSKARHAEEHHSDLVARAPELNPVENVWQYLRANWLSNRVFETTTPSPKPPATPGRRPPISQWE